MPKRNRADEKDWIPIERTEEDDEPTYVTLDLDDVIDELKDLDELSVLVSEPIIDNASTRRKQMKVAADQNDDENEIDIEREEEEVTTTSTLVRESTPSDSYHTKSDEKIKSPASLDTLFSSSSFLADNFWTREERKAAEIVADQVAPGNFIGGSDCAVFALFDRAFSTHKFSHSFQPSEEKKQIVETAPSSSSTSKEQNLEQNNVLENKTIKDNLYLSIKEIVYDRLKSST